MEAINPYFFYYLGFRIHINVGGEIDGKENFFPQVWLNDKWVYESHGCYDMPFYAESVAINEVNRICDV